MRYRDMEATSALRVAGTRHLIEAARLVGARRFVTESMIFGYGYGDHGSAVLTEDDEFGPRQEKPGLDAIVGAIRTKEELTFGTDGLEGISLRFGLFYGAGGTEAIVGMLRRRMLPAPDDGGRVLPWVDLVDAATATVAAVERGRAGAAYNIVDDGPMGFGQHIRAVAEAFGAPAPMRVPRWALRPLGYVHTVFATNMRLSNRKAKAELGWAPTHPSALEALPQLARRHRGLAA